MLKKLRVSGRHFPWWPAEDGDLVGKLVEFLVQIDPQRPQVPVQAQGVAGADGRGAAVPWPLTRIMPAPALRIFMAEKIHSISRASNSSRVFLSFGDQRQVGAKRTELTARFQDGDLESSLEFLGAHGAAGAAADDDGFIHIPAQPFDARAAAVGSLGQALRENEPATAKAGDDALVHGRHEAADLGGVVGCEKTTMDRHPAPGVDRLVDVQQAIQEAQRGRGVGPAADGQFAADIPAQAQGVFIKIFSYCWTTFPGPWPFQPRCG